MMVVNQKLIFETKVTASAAFGWFCLPCAENDILEIPTRSMCQRASCTSGGGENGAPRLSNQWEIKTAHGPLIKVSTRTCETMLLPAEEKIQAVEVKKLASGEDRQATDTPMLSTDNAD